MKLYILAVFALVLSFVHSLDLSTYSKSCKTRQPCTGPRPLRIACLDKHIEEDKKCLQAIKIKHEKTEAMIRKSTQRINEIDNVLNRIRKFRNECLLGSTCDLEGLRKANNDAEKFITTLKRKDAERLMAEING